MRFMDERLLPHDLLLKTENLLKSIDPNDTPFVALAQHLDARLWTGDMQLYNGLKAKRLKNVLTTAELALLLDDLDGQ